MTSRSSSSSPRTPRPDAPVSSGPRALPVAALLMALQCATVLAFTAFYAVELVRGLGDDRSRVEMSIVVFLLGAAALGALAVGLRRSVWWARTPTLLWNVLLLPVCVSLAQAGQHLLAAVVGVVAVATIAATLRRPGR